MILSAEQTIASLNPYVHPIGGSTLVACEKTLNNKGSFTLEQLQKHFSIQKNNTGSSVCWQRTFRTYQYQWEHRMLKGAILRMPAQTWQKEKWPILKNRSVFIFVSHRRHTKWKAFSVSQECHPSYQKAAKLFRWNFFLFQQECYLCKEAGTKSYSLTSSPSISVRDLFDIHRGKAKAFKLLKTVQSSSFGLSFEGQLPTHSIYFPIVKQPE